MITYSNIKLGNEIIKLKHFRNYFLVSERSSEIGNK